MLTVTDLVLERDGQVLHPAVSFDLKKGQALWVKGPNGVGKSTLLKALLGWLPHDGVAVAADTRIAYLGHHTGLPSYLTVWQHCEAHPAIRAFHPKACLELLDVFGLKPYQDTLIGTLSAGQKQRLALVPVFLSDATLWLLDEPLTSLDPASAKVVKTLLTEQLLAGIAMMVVSHEDLSDWATHTLSLEAR